MKLLVLSQYYYPEPGFRTHLLGAGLVQLGHTVTAVTGFPNYPEGCIYPGYRQRIWARENLAGTSVLRMPLYPDHSRSAVRRTLNYVSFAVSASLLGPMLCGPADVMWAYHPPLTVGIPACLIGGLRRIPFVYEIQDMWPETLQSTGMIRSPGVLRMLSSLARLVYRRASAITVVSPGFKRDLVSKGVPESKIHVIPNWADEEIYRPVMRDDTLAGQFGLSGRFNVMFAGNLGAAQALDNVLNASERLRDLPQVQFVFIGSGLEKRKLESAARDRKLSNVRFIDRQPEEQMPRWFALADALLIHLRRNPLFEITIPSKTLAYLACGRPILAAISGDAAELVQASGAGIVCEPEDPEALAESVRQLVRMPFQQRQAMGDAGRDIFLRQFTKSILLRRYESLFLNVSEQNEHL